jgi:hypothetical protein
VLLQEEYETDNAALIEANRRVNLLASAKEAMNHKKKALEYMSQLMLGGYYSDPSISFENKKAIQEESSKEVSGHLKRSKRMSIRSNKT